MPLGEYIYGIYGIKISVFEEARGHVRGLYANLTRLNNSSCGT